MYRVQHRHLAPDPYYSLIPNMLASFITGLMAGLAATPHCLGMCGGFPLHLAKSSARGSVAARQILFIIGKTFTYMFLGALAGAVGVIAFKNTSVSAYAPVLRLAVGVLTVILGLLMMGFRLPSIKPLQGIADTGFLRSIFGGILTKPGPAGALTLGLGVGFLPCPLPMGMLAIAAASHSVANGIILMAGVGLGTAPGLIAVGLFGVGLNVKFAKVGMRAAGVMILLVGLMTIGRVTGVVPMPQKAAQSLPACCGDHK